MAILMLLNHLEFVYGLYTPDVRIFFIYISRCVAPMFAYLAVEGILHTKDLKKYCMRLWVWNAIVFIGGMVLSHFLISLAPNISQENQVYLTVQTHICTTLAAGVLGISLIIWGKQRTDGLKYLFFGLSVVCFVVGFVVEWGVVLIPFMLVTYFLRKKEDEKLLGYFGVEIIAFLFRSEIYYFTVFPFIALFNGKRGPNTKFNQYFFYVFYPVHLWIIAVVNYVMLIT